MQSPKQQNSADDDSANTRKGRSARESTVSEKSIREVQLPAAQEREATVFISSAHLLTKSLLHESGVELDQYQDHPEKYKQLNQEIEQLLSTERGKKFEEAVTKLSEDLDSIESLAALVLTVNICTEESNLSASTVRGILNCKRLKADLKTEYFNHVAAMVHECVISERDYTRAELEKALRFSKNDAVQALAKISCPERRDMALRLISDFALANKLELLKPHLKYIKISESDDVAYLYGMHALHLVEDGDASLANFQQAIEEIYYQSKLSMRGSEVVRIAIEYQFGVGGKPDVLLDNLQDIVTNPEFEIVQDSIWEEYLRLQSLYEKNDYFLDTLTKDFVEHSLNLRAEKRGALSGVLERLDHAYRLASHVEAPDLVFKRIVKDEPVLKAIQLAHRQEKKLGRNTDNIEKYIQPLLNLDSRVPTAQLLKMTEYQVEHGWSCDHLFEQFVVFAEEYISLPERRHRVSFERNVRRTSFILMKHEAPLDFYNGKYHYLAQAPEEQDVAKLVDYLKTMREFSLQFESSFDNEKNYQPGTVESIRQLLKSLTKAGQNSSACRVVSELLSKEQHGVRSIGLKQLAALLKQRPLQSEESWKLLGSLIPYYRKKNLPLRELIKRVVAIEEFEEFVLIEDRPKFWADVREIVSGLVNEGHSLVMLSKLFMNEYSEASTEDRVLYLHFLDGFSIACKKLERAIGPDAAKIEALQAAMRNNLCKLLQGNYGITTDPAMAHKFLLVVKKGQELESLHSFESFLLELKIQALSDVRLSAASAERKEWARELMSETATLDGPPFDAGRDKKASAAYHRETVAIRSRLSIDNRAFGGMALDGRRAPASFLEPVPSMMARCAHDLAQAAHVVNSSSNNVFPGRGGVLFSGLIPEKIFAPDYDFEQRGQGSPFWQYEQALFSKPLFAGFELDDFRASHILASRGVIAVLPPTNERFMLDEQVYALLVYNRHFYPGIETGLLVPRDILWNILKPSLILQNDYHGFDTNTGDITRAGLDYHSLQKVCSQKGVNLLNLGWGSVMGGGLANAYMPGSSPHYEWESHFDDYSDAWRDSWGHMHKATLEHFGGSYFKENLAIIRQLHGEVRDVTQRLQSQIMAFRFTLSLYKKGYTLKRVSDDYDEDLSSQTFASVDEQQQNIQGIDVGPDQYRMLEEAYRFHHGCHAASSEKRFFPQLRESYVIDPTRMPSKPSYLLDTRTMVLVTPEETIQLPTDSDGMGEEERQIWRQYVISQFRLGLEPRLIMPEGAFSFYE